MGDLTENTEEVSCDLCCYRYDYMENYNKVVEHNVDKIYCDDCMEELGYSI